MSPVYICIGLVISLELVNTAGRCGYGVSAKEDCSGVAHCSGISVAVGNMICLWDYYAYMAIASYFARNIWLGIALAAGVILWLVWVFKTPADKDKKDKEKYI